MSVKYTWHMILDDEAIKTKVPDVDKRATWLYFVTHSAKFEPFSCRTNAYLQGGHLAPHKYIAVLEPDKAYQCYY